MKREDLKRDLEMDMESFNVGVQSLLMMENGTRETGMEKENLYTIPTLR
jgi:hypothetical protein